MSREHKNARGFVTGDACRLQGMLAERAVRLNAHFVLSYTSQDGEELAVVKLNCSDPWKRHNSTITVPFNIVKHR